MFRSVISSSLPENALTGQRRRYAGTHYRPLFIRSVTRADSGKRPGFCRASFPEPDDDGKHDGNDAEEDHQDAVDLPYVGIEFEVPNSYEQNGTPGRYDVEEQIEADILQEEES